MSEWINTAKRVPATGALCWIIWADTVQSTAYRRIGLGFACADGYAWQAAHGEGDLIPDGEVSDWMPFPDPPSRFAHKSEHWRNPETGQVECECCCRGALDYDVQRHELKQARARIAELEQALSGVLPYMEVAESSGLIGHEGCHWPVELVRAALKPAEPPTEGL